MILYASKRSKFYLVSDAEKHLTFPFFNDIFNCQFFLAKVLVLLSHIKEQNVRHLINESDKVSSVPTKEECYCRRFVIQRRIL